MDYDWTKHTHAHTPHANEYHNKPYFFILSSFGKVLHPAYRETHFTLCNISDIEDDKGFLVEHIAEKFTTEMCTGKSSGHSTFYAL